MFPKYLSWKTYPLKCWSAKGCGKWPSKKDKKKGVSVAALRADGGLLKQFFVQFLTLPLFNKDSWGYDIGAVGEALCACSQQGLNRVGRRMYLLRISVIITEMVEKW